jgi:hypothetical protein
MRSESNDNKKLNLNWRDTDFRRYRLLIKIFGPDKIEHQNLEIYTTGLKQLLEMRRVHARTFDNMGADIIERNAVNN